MYVDTEVVTTAELSENNILALVHILRQYFESKDPVSGEESITLVTKLEKALADDIIHHASVQTQITDFYAV